ncbi:uncharacterized protein LOC119097993 [Pollicipes pollicipes]|uniref:uncharacterized protein LOC119097993 n=1 Tax=Pollicipes pollicipes TaxID=41117 RepID=UPI0018850CD1|nr:uncharacterized protein LOC119097993 [Pollicipes pollicipes]
MQTGSHAAVTCLESGWFIDELAQLTEIYGPAAGAAPVPELPLLRSDARLWDIRTPFLMDQQAARLARELETGAGEPRRRRRPRPPHPTAPCPVLCALERLLAERRAAVDADADPDQGPTADDYRSNNASARQAARRLLERAAAAASSAPLLPLHDANPADRPRLLTLDGRRYVLPARSRFLCDDVTRSFEGDGVVQRLLGGGARFDCILLDPPWTNKFVRRKRRHLETDGYEFLESASLARLPVARLAADGALVAVWCTNSAAHQHTLRHVLFPAWGVTECATWHWAKVTQHGRPVSAAGQHSKRPYEPLVLGRRGPPGAVGPPPPPPHRLLVSVPSAVHSRKPLLHEVLRPYLPPDYRGLEVFARSLLPGWTSWGDQVLLLQELGALLLPEAGCGDTPHQTAQVTCADGDAPHGDGDTRREQEDVNSGNVGPMYKDEDAECRDTRGEDSGAGHANGKMCHISRDASHEERGSSVGRASSQCQRAGNGHECASS